MGLKVIYTEVDGNITGAAEDDLLTEADLRDGEAIVEFPHNWPVGETLFPAGFFVRTTEAGPLELVKGGLWALEEGHPFLTEPPLAPYWRKAA